MRSEKIIGNSREQAELNDVFHSTHAELVAVYGRRRVGKTHLIKNFFLGKQAVYFQMTGIYRGSVFQQLSRFSKEIGEAFYQGASIQIPKNWFDAFEELTHAINLVPKNKKIVIFLDELPWIATRKSGAISALEYFWNRFWVSDKRIKLIVCGSAASWLIKKIIKNKGGLHNRVTKKIRLSPFDLHETALYLKHIGYPADQQQTLKLYMVTGGVPFYLNQLKKNYSIDQNIDYLFFNADGALFDEFDEVFSSLFENAEQYKELITLIGKYKDGISRSMLNRKVKLTGKGGRLTRRLEDLEHAGFISTFIPYGHKKNGMFYRINDEYCYFYLKWIEPIKNQLKQNKITKYWKRIINTPAYFGWLGYAFENVCYKHLPQIKKALNIEETSLGSPWRYAPRKGATEKGAQIDLLFDSHDAIFLCEIKYTMDPFIIDKSVAILLQQKKDTFKKISRTRKQIFITLISENNYKETQYSRSCVTNFITLKDLFDEVS